MSLYIKPLQERIAEGCSILFLGAATCGILYFVFYYLPVVVIVDDYIKTKSIRVITENGQVTSQKTYYRDFGKKEPKKQFTAIIKKGKLSCSKTHYSTKSGETTIANPELTWEFTIDQDPSKYSFRDCFNQNKTVDGLWRSKDIILKTHFPNGNTIEGIWETGPGEVCRYGYFNISYCKPSGKFRMTFPDNSYAVGEGRAYWGEGEHQPDKVYLAGEIRVQYPSGKKKAFYNTIIHDGYWRTDGLVLGWFETGEKMFEDIRDKGVIQSRRWFSKDGMFKGEGIYDWDKGEGWHYHYFDNIEMEAFPLVLDEEGAWVWHGRGYWIEYPGFKEYQDEDINDLGSPWSLDHPHYPFMHTDEYWESHEFIRHESGFDMNVHDGKDIGWHDNGEKHWEFYWEDGKAVGPMWHSHGEGHSIWPLDEFGKVDGLVIFYDVDGNRIDEQLWEDGNLVE